MKIHKTANRSTMRLAALLITALLALPMLLPLAAHAKEAEEQTVRVGWHEEPYFYVDEFGRRFGYSYEYQQKIAAYTGWKYEYVEGGWSDLLKKLKSGEIDMLANVSYTEERAQDFLFASMPMGTEAYYIFVSPDNEDITAEDYTSLNGKKVGVAKGSMQGTMFREWAASHHVDANVVEMTVTESESLDKLGSELDAVVTMDVNIDPAKAEPLYKIGSSDFFFAVSKDRQDLLGPLNAAMDRIQDDNIYYSQQLSEKYFNNSDTNMYLTAEEQSWLKDHGKIRVGYQDGYLAFCAKDPKTGELTGALKDYLDYASDAWGNADVEFETVAYPSAGAAMEAVQKGEIDCMFPANLIPSDAEQMDLVMTPALMTTEMDAVVRASEQKEFIKKENVTVCVNKGNTNYEMFLTDHFPGWKIKYYPDTPTGLEAIAAGEADCVIISNYRYTNIAEQCEKLKLATVYTGVDMDYYLAVRRQDTELYSILSKMTTLVPDSMVHSALTYYSTEDAKMGFTDMLKEHWLAVLLGVAAVLLLIIFLLLRSIRMERKAKEEADVISNLNRQVFVDALTHVRNKGGYDNYLKQLQTRLDNGEPMEIGIAVFDCDDLKEINDEHGHDKGNQYLLGSSHLICEVFMHSPVFRIGGDEFVVILLGEDYDNREELLRQFDEKQAQITDAAENDWEKVRVSSGLAVYDPLLDDTLKALARRADQEMYENKRIRKS